MEDTAERQKRLSSTERRGGPRVAMDVPFGIRFPEGEVKEGWGRIINMSAEGLLVETRFPMKVSGVIYVSFVLKNGIRFDNLRARIIRSTYEEGYFVAGIAFDDVVDQETLKDVLSSLAAEGGLGTI